MPKHPKVAKGGKGKETPWPLLSSCTGVMRGVYWRSLGPGGEGFSLKTGRHLGHCCPWLVLASATKWVVEDEDRAAPALHKELLQIVVTLVKAGLI